MEASPPTSRLVSALLVVAVVAVAFALVRGAEAGPVPAFASVGGHRGSAVQWPPTAARGLELAGSGTNLPLTRKLAERFTAARPGQRVHVHDSIGSTGGVHAVSEGAVPIGLVSRPLSDAERGPLRVMPYARVPVVLAVHPSVTEVGISRAELLALYRGERPRWSDGSAAVVLQRERGDSSHRAVERVLPGFAEVNVEAWRQRRFRVLYSDGAMEAALLQVPGAVGLFDSGAIAAHGLPLRALAIDGVAPSAQSLAAGRYPFYKELSFVVRGEPGAAARAFFDFVYGAEGRAIIAQYGYVPVPAEGR